VRGLGWDGRGRPVGERGLRTAFTAGASRLDAVGWSLAALPADERPGLADVTAHLVIDSCSGRPALEVVDVAPGAP
jgi:hypothetical protein